jgi:hypothetical protein
MTSLSDHSSAEFVKVLYIGSSGSGKTGSLASLIPDYDLRIIDMDNGLDSLANLARRDHGNRIASVEYVTLRDKMKSSPMGPQLDGVPKAMVAATKLLDKWTDGSVPAEWGPKKVLVLDSLTHFAQAAFNWAKGMNPSAKEPRQWYKTAQDHIVNVLSLLTSDDFRANVIICTHIDWREDAMGASRGYANSIGTALNDKLPSYFNTMLLAESRLMGKNVQRRIFTMPTNLIDLKNPAPWKLEAEYPLETGMATIFKKLKGE